MKREDVINKLFELKDEKYRDFHSKLCPNTLNIIGVRVPMLRNLAKEILKNNWKEFFENVKDEYYEEILLQGMIIGLIKKEDINEVIKYVKIFVPKINNWAVCDTFCSGLKITTKYPEIFWSFIRTYLNSENEFELRFLIVMLLEYFINDKYIDNILEIFDNIKHEGYYVKMALAWAISIAFIKYPEKTKKYLETNTLDNFTYNKSLQKITESYRVNEATKNIIKNMKKNNNR